MKAVFRVDSSRLIGAGHIMRCLTLGEELKKIKIEVIFVCRNLPGNIAYRVEEHGFRLIKLGYYNANNTDQKTQSSSEQYLGADIDTELNDMNVVFQSLDNVDLLIVDHYSIDEYWETSLRQFTKKLMVLDDLANRKHNCDILVDQNPYNHKEHRYHGLLPGNAIRLLGETYSILRDEFINKRVSSAQRLSKVSKILVSFGGADSVNYLGKLLAYINKHFDVYAGFNFTFILGNSVVQQSLDFNSLDNCKIYKPVKNMSDFMLTHDICIGSIGVTSWERCCMGMSSLVLCNSPNQEKLAKDCDNSIHILLDANTFFLDKYALYHHLTNVERLNEIATNAHRLIDGKGKYLITREILNAIA